jgi:hypothetical protein
MLNIVYVYYILTPNTRLNEAKFRGFDLSKLQLGIIFNNLKYKFSCIRLIGRVINY